MKRSKGEKVFNIVNIILMAVFIAMFLFPILIVIKNSLDASGLSTTSLSIIPKEFSTVYYKIVLSDNGIYRPFINSIFITLAGTVLSVFVQAMGAYTLSKRDLPGNRIFTYMIIIPMMFSGGLVPLYLLIKNLKLINTMGALILPVCISAWNTILIRNYYDSIPKSLHESATIDGAEEYTIFFRIIFPLSKSIIATIALFTGLMYWNMFFNAVMFINDPKKYTFPVKLYEMIMVQQELEDKMNGMASSGGSMIKSINQQGISSAMIVISLIPIMIIYPFLQKYFVKGIMVGSIKG